jgi:ribosome maturation factor RimP
MEQSEITEELKKVVQPILEDGGFELIEISFNRSRFSATLALFVDRVGGGVTIGECALLNRKVGEFLDTSSIIQERYLLEVSSPGIDRLLKTKNDFLRCVGKDVKFFLREAINGKIEFTARVLKAEDETVFVEIKNSSLEIALLNIAKAKQVI